jgi:adenine-specific DNA-methyltransferase
MTEMRSQLPTPLENERPTAYADRVGRWYAGLVSVKHQKGLGQYLTPVEVADFMAGLCQPSGRVLRVRDPGAGAGVLSCAVCEALASRKSKPVEVQLEAYEVDARLASCLEVCLSYVQRWLQARGVSLKFRVHTDDFVMRHAEALNDAPRLFPTEGGERNRFDLIISNPPYFKLPKSDPRAQAAAAVVHGQPNIYALFMAISAALLKPGGELVFITPRSYAAGSYFRLFRERFFAVMQPKAVHLFHSRREAFSRDEVLQENVILLAQRRDNWFAQADKASVMVSVSNGARDLFETSQRCVPLSEVLDYRSKDKVLRIPVADEEDRIVRVVQSWRGSLHAYGLEISTGPVVAFRAKSLIEEQGNVAQTHAPLLWMQNVKPMQVQWLVEAKGKGQFIRVEPRSMSLLLPNRNYVLLRRFSAKEERRRLVAAPFLTHMINTEWVGLENHLNYVHRPRGSLSEEEAYGLAALFNSSLLDTYFRTFNGNTQVNATELRAMPLPPLEAIQEIGRRMMEGAEDIDACVAEVLDLSP